MNAMPMLVMTGKVDNIFLQPEGTNKKTGETYGGRYKVQLRVDLPLPNGETRRDIVDLSTDHPEDFRTRQDQQVSLPVGAMGSSRGVIFYILKGWSPPVAGVAARAGFQGEPA